MALLVLVGFALIFTGCIYAMQHRMMYHPQQYPVGYERTLDSRVQLIHSTTSQGAQVAPYLPPRDGNAPLRLWLLFHGNGATALDWQDFIEQAPDAHAGYLLIDYPGYGDCEGTAWGRGILESTRAALDALATQVGVPRAQLEKDINLLGFSMGAAAAMQYAPEVKAGRIVLIAPFSSIQTMARQTVGWPLCYLLRERYDNVARMREVLTQSPKPRVVIFHGVADTIIPIEQSRVLKAIDPAAIELHEVPGADHDWILDAANKEILACMAPPPA